jgi:hypothetical protein
VKLCAKRKFGSEEKRSDLRKRGKICKLCALIKVRIVKSFRYEIFVLCKSKISGNVFVSKVWTQVCLIDSVLA